MNLSSLKVSTKLIVVISVSILALFSLGITGYRYLNSSGESMNAMYQDMLMGGGNYVLERSKWRDFTWASGLANTGIGRALQIGGRRPEFLSGGEFQYQMERSVPF